MVSEDTPSEDSDAPVVDLLPRPEARSVPEREDLDALVGGAVDHGARPPR